MDMRLRRLFSSIQLRSESDIDTEGVLAWWLGVDSWAMIEDRLEWKLGLLLR
jgi:hypothetical protein